MLEIDLQIDDFMIECSVKGLSKKTIGSYESIFYDSLMSIKIIMNY